MINAVRRAQRAGLLHLVLSPRRGRETACANPGQVASGAARGVDFGALAERDDARGMFAGSAAPGGGGAGAKTQTHALCRPKRRSVATAPREKSGPCDARQR